MKLGALVLLSSVVFVASTPVGTCPPTNQRPTVYLPHATDCSLFFLCNFGTPLEMPPCAAGTKFDTVTSRCAPEATAVCYGSVTTTGTTTPPPIEPTTTVEELTTTISEDTTTVEELTTVPEELTTTAGPDTTVSAIPTAPRKFQSLSNHLRFCITL